MVRGFACLQDALCETKAVRRKQSSKVGLYCQQQPGQGAQIAREIIKICGNWMRMVWVWSDLDDGRRRVDIGAACSLFELRFAKAFITAILESCSKCVDLNLHIVHARFAQD